MLTTPVPCTDLGVGDQYIVATARRGVRSLETRTVLGVLSSGRFMGEPAALLEVRSDDGNVHRAHWHGTVDRIDGQPCRACGELFPYDPDADRCPQCVAADGFTAEDIAAHAARDQA